MQINRWLWRELNSQQQARIMTRASLDISEQIEKVLPIIAAVRERGDAAVVEFTEAFDRVKMSAGRIRVTEAEWQQGLARVTPDMRATLSYAAQNIRKFHAAQMPEPIWMMEIDKGIMAGEKVTPISDVALYVPRGKGSFPSVLLMLGTPAVVAGVPRIIVITPPNEQGEVDPAILYAAELLGIREIYKVGGAQAIAAVAYGTETIPKCAKVIGPGNTYVTAAKRVLMGTIDPGVPAGPSEAIILADDGANPHNVALDLLIEAEHGPDSASLLVTPSSRLADAVAAELEQLIASITNEKRREFVTTVLQNYGGIFEFASMEEAVEFVNAYAPEHMEVQVREPFAILPAIKNAGEILLGDYTPITLCNFLLGPNAILPTGRNAHTISAVSIHDFVKRSSIGYVTKEGFAGVRDHAIAFAEMEGFETHGKAVRERE